MENKDKIKYFERAVRFQLEGLIFLAMRSRKGGIGSWVIEDKKQNKVLNSNMEWENDLPKSKIDEAYLIRTRFDFDTAIVMYEQYKMFAV